MSVGAGVYYLVDGIFRLKERLEKTQVNSGLSVDADETEEGSDPIEELVLHEVVLDEPLNSQALVGFGRLLRLYGVLLTLCLGVGLLSGEPFFRRWEIVEVLMVLAMWPIPPLLIAAFLAKARKRLEVDRARGLVVLQVTLGKWLLRDSQIPVSKIDRIEMRELSSWGLPVPAELKQVLVLARLEDGTTTHLGQVAEMGDAKRIASALRVL